MHQLMFLCMYVQWNLSVTHFETRYFSHFLLQRRGWLRSFGTKIFVLIMEVFSIVSLIQRVCVERFHLSTVYMYACMYAYVYI